MFKQYLDTEYDIAPDGRCFSHKTNKLLKPQMSVKYPTYNLTYPDGKKRKTKIHRMVAETFLPRIEGKNIVNHIDGDTHNYNLSNLEWVSDSENSKHAAKIGLTPKGNYTPNFYVNNIDDEKWISIKDYPLYKISSIGRIMNINTKRILKPCITPGGYYQVALWKNRKQKSFLVHILVYSNFNEDYDLKGFVINHKDGNKLNSNIENLEKITYGENNRHAEYVIKTHCCAKPVNQLDSEGNIVNTFSSISEASRQLGISNISRAIKNNCYAGGYKWEFSKNN